MKKLCTLQLPVSSQVLESFTTCRRIVVTDGLSGLKDLKSIRDLDHFQFLHMWGNTSWLNYLEIMIQKPYVRRWLNYLLCKKQVATPHDMPRFIFSKTSKLSEGSWLVNVMKRAPQRIRNASIASLFINVESKHVELANTMSAFVQSSTDASVRKLPS